MNKGKKIKDLNQPEILKDTRIVIFFSYLVILSIVFYISYKLYQNKRKPLSISSQTFALIETKSSLPENTFLDLGNTSYDKIKQEVDQINSLKYCNQGQCVLDIKAGTKRCPGNKNTSLMFNPALELCTDPYSCPDSQPFAVQSTGETKLKYCEPDIPCRCITEKYCAPYVSQILEITNGNPWVQNNGYKNFSITALSNGSTEGFNFNPSIIDPTNESTQYCKINPEFTQRMENGCKFDVNAGEPMDCNSGSYLKFIQNLNPNLTVYSNTPNGSTFWKNINIDQPINTSTNIYQVKTNNTQLLLYNPTTSWNPNQEGNKYSQTSLLQEEIFLPPSGMFTTGDGNNYSFTYNGVINYKQYTFDTSVRVEETNRFYKTYTNLVTVLLNTAYNGKPGLPPMEPGTKLILTSYVYSECIKTLLPSDNYKNMLNCTQDENQPCVDGVLAYNVDKEDPRDFSQYNLERDLSNYLNDPSFYTVSFVKGGGFSKLIDTSLCEGSNCIPAYNEKKSKFHTEMDDSAIATQWLLEHENYQNGFSESYTYDVTSKKITFDTNNSLLTLENGDYWSLQSLTIEAYSKEDYPKNTSTFQLNDVTNIRENMEVVYPGMCTGPSGNLTVSVQSVDSSLNQVVLSSQSYEGICASDQFKFFTVLNSNQYGLITNCSKNSSGVQTCTLTDLYGNNNNINIGTSPFIDVYKQFGFNGINYNTKLSYDPINGSSFHGYRKYSENSIINIGNVGSTSGPFYEKFENVTPPLSAINIFQDGVETDYYTQTFTDPYALYKRFNSMYYPVWNNNSYKQECVIPLPFLVAYPILDDLVGSNESIGRILIQFSGKHFGHYASYNDSFCYNLFTPLKKVSKITDLVSTNQILVLDQINTNVSANNLIASSDCSFDIYFVPNKELNGSQTPPSGVSFQVSIASKNMTSKNYTQLENKFMPLVYESKQYDDSNSYIIGNGDTYNFYNTSGNENYFLGKVYSGTIGTSTYYFDLKSYSQVLAIDQNIIETNMNSVNILPNDILIQFLDPNETLQIGFVNNLDETSPGFGCSFRVNSITQDRITDITIDNYGQQYLPENRPLVGVTKYKLKNN